MAGRNQAKYDKELMDGDKCGDGGEEVGVREGIMGINANGKNTIQINY